MRRFPHYVVADDPSIDRAAVSTMTRLAATKFLTPTSKIGVVYLETPEYTSATTQALLPTAQRLGLNVVATQGLPLDSTQAPQAASSAVLKFRNAGVDRVLFVDFGGAALLYFGNAALAAQYYPLYGLSTPSSAAVVVDSGFVPAKVFAGSQGVGWMPVYDTSYQSSRRFPDVPERERCLTVMRNAGLVPSSSAEEFMMLRKCDMAWLLAAALRRSGIPTADGVVSGVTGLGSTFNSAMTFRTLFGPSRLDGVAAARDFTYQSSCSCFQYSSAVYAIQN